ncbi:MAG: protein translocase subunit SecD [Anaerovoracaceae bacterium]|jgi:SecD/SecF fusion protein|nr:protein translocase subunit SecD [Anaerovoracaceae bacterium]
MTTSSKKIVVVFIIIILLFGWWATLFGIGPLDPIKDKMKLGLDIKGGVYVVLEAKTDEVGEDLKKIMEQTQAVIENRVNQMGLSEPVVTIEGDKRIRVELPGAEDANEAIEMIGKTAQLEFALADGTLVLNGSDIKNAGVTTDQDHGGYAISLEMTREGGAKFEEATRLAVSGTIVSAYEGISNRAIIILLDGEVVSSPVPSEVISGGNAIITNGTMGGFDIEYASNTAALIRGGALPVGLEEITSSVQTAKIGINALEKSVVAGFVGLLLIVILMFVFYQIMGFAANIALLLYVVLILWIMATMGAVLTLPGIAGIILSLGMAVDANVVIFSRIREEIINGKTIRVATQLGFKRALSTIIDSQLTTLIAAVVLYQVGTSSVKGFALTLMIGIVVSIFTAVVVTQVLLHVICESKKFSQKKYFGVRKDGTGIFSAKRQFKFIEHRKIYYMVSIGIIVLGLLVGGIRGLNYGIDFTGGTMMQFDMGKQVTQSQVRDVLDQYELDEEIIFSGNENKEIIIRTTKALENADRMEIVGSFEESFGINEDDILAIEQFGPSVGKELQRNALLAILISALGMLIYISIRFQWKFGVAALAGVIHDVLMVLAFYAIFNITVNNPFIAGVLTVVGYSINDTIVVFDRVRENLGLLKKTPLLETLNISINQTIQRSVMTSVTTLLVMVPLFILSGPAIREFVVPLMVGVAVGCISSITLCSPLYNDICKWTGGSKYKAKKSRRRSKK